MVFADRDDAGRRLAARLAHLRGEPVVVLGLPRGGIPVAFQVTGWLRAQPVAAHAAVGYFGASTGAAAALWAAAGPGAGIAAVVSRGGRPDLARPRLAAVTAPVLLDKTGVAGKG
jgi:hypothetical protein